MKEYWLIDGYNLLHSIRRDRQQSKFSREALFESLASFASQGERRVLVVLDGVGKDAEWEAYATASFRIVYAQEEPADTLIERLVQEAKGTVRTTVITEDRSITHMARGCGARVMGAKDFRSCLDEGKQTAKESLRKHERNAHGFHRPFEDKLKDFPLD